MKFMEVQTVNKSKRQSRRVTRDPQSTPYRFCWTGRPTSERLTEDVVARHSVGTFFNDAPGELGMDIRPSIEPLAATAAQVDRKPGQNVMVSVKKPLTVTGGVVGLKGGFDPNGAIVRVADMKQSKFSKPAGCSGLKEPIYRAGTRGQYQKGCVSVVEYEGHIDGPDVREMWSIPAAYDGWTMVDEVARATDERFPGAAHGFCFGAADPEAAPGGLIDFLDDDETIAVDVEFGQMGPAVNGDVLEMRKRDLRARKNGCGGGVVRKNSLTVGSVCNGAAADPGGQVEVVCNADI